MVVEDQAGMGEGSANPTDPHHTPTFIQPSTSQPQKKQKPRKPKRKDTQIPQSSSYTKHVADEAVHKERGDSLVRAATTASSLEVEQDSETTKTTQANEITSLKRRVKKVEQKKRSRTHKLKRLYGRINVIDADEDITLVIDQDDADIFDVITLTALKSAKVQEKGDVIEEPSVPVSVASTKVSAATTTATATIPSPRKGIIITKLGISTTTTTTISSQPSKAKVQDKGKGILLQAEFDEEERLAREKDEANVALTEE
ncbi:hypothetical protein Tco_1393808 [Tanacetum coccineum]